MIALQHHLAGSFLLQGVGKAPHLPLYHFHLLLRLTLFSILPCQVLFLAWMIQYLALTPVLICGSSCPARHGMKLILCLADPLHLLPPPILLLHFPSLLCGMHRCVTLILSCNHFLLLMFWLVIESTIKALHPHVLLKSSHLLCGTPSYKPPGVPTPGTPTSIPLPNPRPAGQVRSPPPPPLPWYSLHFPHSHGHWTSDMGTHWCHGASP